MPVFLLLVALLPVGAFAGDQPGKWGVAERNGVRWLVTPQGRLFYSKGVNIVVPGKKTPKSDLRQEYYWGNFYRSSLEWCSTVNRRLEEWGFNTRGGWSDPNPNLQTALTVDLELGRNSRYHWFDPFDPEMERTMDETALKLTAPYRDNPRLLGYFTDNEVGWWNTPLFSYYLESGWESHTKRALWNVIHDFYAGDWTAFLVDWSPDASIHGFEDLKRAGVKLRLRPGGRGIRVVDRFLYLYVQRYYRLASSAVRKAHPGALVLGDRLPLYYHQDAVLAIGDSLDVVSTNYNVDVPDGWVAPYFFEGLQKLSDRPVIITEFFFAAQENRSGNRNETARNIHAKPGHLMTVGTQAERAWGAGNAVMNFARFPNVVGAHWFQCCDEPMGGRDDGEDYNMGLIDTSDRPYEEVTQMFRKINPALETIHGEASSSQAEQREAPKDTPVPIARAERPIDVSDQSLLDWDERKTRLTGFQTEKPHVPFGDVHLAWRPEGLYMATIADTYVDPRFLDCRGEFPREEAFQAVLDIQPENGSSTRYGLYLIPADNPNLPDGFEIKPRLFRFLPGKSPEAIPVGGRVQRIEKSLPHMMTEAFFPAREFGVDHLEPGMKLRIGITLTSYYHEFSMIWAGSPGDGVESSLREVVLE